MQANRPNAAKGRSRSPGREPFGAGGLSSQLNSLSLRTSPTKQGTGSTVRGASLHKKSKSATGQPVFDRSRSGSPVKQQTNSRHGSAVPLKTSPSKADARRAYGHDAFVSTSKTPSKSIIARAGLSKSLGAGTVYKKDSIVAAGGLGRMDIATKDWDGSVSAGVSPKKRSLSAKVRFEPPSHRALTLNRPLHSRNTTASYHREKTLGLRGPPSSTTTFTAKYTTHLIKMIPKFPIQRQMTDLTILHLRLHIARKPQIKLIQQNLAVPWVSNSANGYCRFLQNHHAHPMSTRPSWRRTLVVMAFLENHQATRLLKPPVNGDGLQLLPNGYWTPLAWLTITI